MSFMVDRKRQFLLFYNIGTIFLMGWFAFAFLTKGATTVSETIVNLYLVVLGFYVGDKEIERWRKQYHSHGRRGEYFVFGWAIVGAAMLLIEIFGGAEHGYKIPKYFAFVVGTVLIVYFITAYLKAEHRRRE